MLEMGLDEVFGFIEEVALEIVRGVDVNGTGGRQAGVWSSVISVVGIESSVIDIDSVESIDVDNVISILLVVLN